MGTLSTPTKLQVKRGDMPDESRPFVAHGRAEIHEIGSGTVMRGVFEPGWKWSKDVAPLAGTTSCRAPHLGYCLAGRMRIRTDDGIEQEITPGDFFRIMPGHDAWVVGTETCILLDFAGYGDYAKAMTSPSSRTDERGAPAQRDRR